MSDKNNESWAIKRAIYDMMDRNLLEIPNKKTMMKFIKDDISNDDLFTLYSLLEIEDNKLSVDFLTECYFNNLKQNSDLPIFNEREILNQRDSVLTEAEDQEKLSAKDIHLMIKKYGLFGAIGYLVKRRYLPPVEGNKLIEAARKQSAADWDAVVKKSFLRHILPSSDSPKLKAAWTDAKESPVSGTWRAGKTYTKHMYKKLKTAAATPAGIKHITRGKKVATYAAIITGTVGALAGAYSAYKYYMDTKNARSACQKFKGQQKDICILKYQIAASETALSVLQNSKSKCSQASNPEKCTYGINQAIWKWQQRKVKYLTKLNKLSGKTTEEVSKKIPKKESPF